MEFPIPEVPSDIPDGQPQDKADHILLHIEARTLYTTRLTRALLRQTLTGSQSKITEYDFYDLVSLFVDPTVQINIHDIESCIPSFREIVPDQPQVLSALARAISQKYPFAPSDVPSLGALLRLDDDDVDEAYRELFDCPLDDIYAVHATPDKRPFWLRLPGQTLKEMIKDLVQETEWVYLPAGETLYNQGDIGDSLYSVVGGRIRAVRTNDDGESSVLAEYGRGGIVGELVFMTQNHPRTASVYAIRDSELIKVSGDGLERLATKHPSFGLRVTREIINGIRQNASGQYRSSRPATIVVLPTSPKVPLEAFMDRFEQALSCHGSVYYLTSRRFDGEHGVGASQLPQEDARNSALVEWLNDLELAHDYVLLATDSELTEWSRRCLRTADLILIVADANEDPRPRNLERQISASDDLKLSSKTELVLLHSSRDRRPSGTMRWLEHRELRRHHHVHWGSEQDIERLGRLVSGKASGLVLGGGGARGMAHIGVMRALQENGVVVDAVCGVSFGSIIGACVALGWDWQRMDEVMHDFVLRRKRYFRPTLPLVSLLGGKGVSRIFQELYGNANLEDLWQPFFCLSSNLNRSKLEMLTQGSVWNAVRASMSVPGIFPPVLKDGELLVDGGIINNMPADIMKDWLEGGTVMVSNTSPEQSMKYAYRNDASPWQALWSRLNPLKNIEVPSVVDVLSQTMGIMNKWQKPRQLMSTDLLFEIPVEKYRLFDYDAIDELIEAGYQTAMIELENLDRVK